MGNVMAENKMSIYVYKIPFFILDNCLLAIVFFRQQYIGTCITSLARQ